MRLSNRGRELVVGVAIAALFVAGVALDLGGGVSPDVSEPAPEESPLPERALFCPPTLRTGSAFLAMASPLDEGVSVGVEPGFREQTELPAGRMLLDEVDGRSPLDVIGLGSEVAASYTTEISGRFRGVGSASCSRTAAENWHFADGSSARGFDQRLLIYNPFPDEAVVRVVFHTRSREISRANLANVAVPSGATARIRVNDFILRRPLLGASVTAARGRVVAWRLLLDEGEDRPRGVHMSLGAESASEVWYFPHGPVGPGIDQRLAILNPTDEEAIVTVSLTASDGVVQIPEIAETLVPPKTTIRIRLPQELPDADGDRVEAGAIVQSTNGIPVVAERTVYYSTQSMRGAASEVGATEPAVRWVVGPAAADPTVDSLSIMNPGGEDATVTVMLLRTDRDPLAPEELAEVRVAAGARVRLPLASFTKAAPLIALVVSDRPVVAERFAYSERSRDVSALMGTPLTKTP